MLHFFLAHSHICHAVAAGVVEHEGLEPRQVKILTWRGLELPDSRFPSTALPSALVAFPRRGGLRACRRRLRDFDTWLNHLVEGRPFHFYTPQTQLRPIQLIRSSPLCKGFSLLEEGLASYRTRSQLEALAPRTRWKWRDRLGYGGRIAPASFFEDGARRAYAVHPEAFPGISGRVVLDGVLSKPLGSAPEGVRSVIVCDGMAQHGAVRAESVFYALERVIESLRDADAGRVHYKLHPAQLGTEEERAIRTLFARRHAGLEFCELGSEVSLEALALSGGDVRFIVGVSSAGLYAALSGRRVVSYAGWVCEVEPGFARHVDGLPTIYRERLEFLGPSPLAGDAGSPPST